MRRLFTIIAITFFTNSFGQTADAYFKIGIEKHHSKDLDGAIKEYSKAIKEDNTMTLAYFNRGMCELALQDFKSAMKDFDKTIELNPKIADAYYSRATVFVSQKKYPESLTDLDRAIAIEPTTMHALTLRGQIKASLGDKKGACEDFNHAKEIGDKEADQYLSKYCGNKQQGGESLSLHWPESENWKLENSQENEEMTMMELIPSNETLDNWTEIGTMMAIKDVRNIPMDVAMNMMFDQAKKNSPKAKLTFIEKDESVEYPWIIFTIESPNFKNDKKSESQLWYITQGKTSLYTNFRAIKQPEIPTDLKNKWIHFFKTAKVVNQ